MDIDPNGTLVADASAPDGGQRAELLPLLWSASSPKAEMLEIVPHEPVVDGHLYVGLATVVTHLADGKLGLVHMAGAHERFVTTSFGTVLDEAQRNLKSGLKIEGMSSEDGELLTLQRDGGAPIAAAIALPDFHECMADLIGDERLIVGLPCPMEVIVAAAGSVWAPRIEEEVLSSTYPDSELVPSVLTIDSAGVTLRVER